MRRPGSPQLRHVLAHPRDFALGVLRAFRANQGLLLAGAVAYYALLSIVPLLLLVLIALSHVVDLQLLLATLQRYLDWLVPGRAAALVADLAHFVEHREVVGWVLLAVMLFFSALAFTVLENAMSVIFVHRVAIRRRHALWSALLPFAYIGCLGLGLLVVSLVSGGLQAMGRTQLDWLGHRWSLDGLSGLLLYLTGVAGELALLTSLYMVMPVGRLRWSHALAGGVVATVLWELTRHVLVWYYARLSQVNLVYGSMATAIVVLLSLEFAATLLLLGAQVIAEFERAGSHGAPRPPETFHTLQPETPR